LIIWDDPDQSSAATNLAPQREDSIHYLPSNIPTLLRLAPTMPSDDADLHCPNGGTFYACSQGSMFLGCCKSDPCSNGCGDGDLIPASFNVSYSGSFPDQFCPSGDFYTCRMIDPSFLGCCKSNPCQQEGCPNNDLVAASLLSGAAAADFPTSTSSSTTASSTAASPTSSSASQSASASARATSSPTVIDNQGLSRGAIAGIAVGSFIALLAIAAVVVAFCARQDSRSPPSEKRNSMAVRKEEPDGHYYAPQGQAELAAPEIRPNEFVKGERASFLRLSTSKEVLL
jgi:hypothetical protein